MPLSSELSKAYASYYTHASSIPEARPGSLRALFRAIKRSYLSNRYGYRDPSRPSGSRALGWLLYLFPVRRSDVDAEIRFLHAQPGGRLLDIGCGSGAWLGWMRTLGWEVEGIDFDENAIQAARGENLNVHTGTLEAQSYPSDTFDVINLNHVIEHVPDPVGLLTEIRRILKPGGKLVLATPNAASIGHRLFGSDWRGLEPPRHLHIFTPPSMLAALQKAGFSEVTLRTLTSAYVWAQSTDLWLSTGPGKSPWARLTRAFLPRILSVLAEAWRGFRPFSGECFAVDAIKSRPATRP
jgi:2-polyprenyl-3-methyl-5-hydroxy-6-metoxy-1,4-benzoquinol methylase